MRKGTESICCEPGLIVMQESTEQGLVILLDVFLLREVSGRAELPGCFLLHLCSVSQPYANSAPVTRELSRDAFHYRSNANKHPSNLPSAICTAGAQDTWARTPVSLGLFSPELSCSCTRNHALPKPEGRE